MTAIAESTRRPDPATRLVCERWGRNVRNARDALRLQQDDVADEANVSQPTISAIERGRVEPTLRVRLAIAAALGCGHDDLFSVDGVPANPDTDQSARPLTPPLPQPRQRPALDHEDA